jgi:transposase
MAGNERCEDAKLDLQATHLEEGFMVGEDRWQEIRRLRHRDHVPIAEIARRLELDRKTVRHCLKQPVWQSYQRPARTDTLLVKHAEFLRERAPKVGYSAQVLFQELKGRGYAGGYPPTTRSWRREVSDERAPARTPARADGPAAAVQEP